MEPLLAAPGLLLVVCCCVPAFQAAVRARFLKPLRQTVHAQLPWVSRAQSTHNPVLTALVGVGAFSVTVEFFLLLLPTLMWTGHQELCLQLTMVLTFATFANSALKDILCSPRPHSLRSTGQLSDPTAASDTTAFTLDASVDEVEYGAPSLHVCLTLCMTAHTLARCLGDPALPSPGLLLALGAAWVAWVAWGRLYLGVHSPVDLALGAAVGAAILSTTLRLGDPYLAWSAATPASAPIHLLAFLAMLRLYPRPEEYTTSYLYATTFLGAWLGFIRFLRTAPAPPTLVCPLVPPPLRPLLAHPAALLAAKLVAGYTLTLLAKMLSKLLITLLITSLYSLAPAPLAALFRTALLPPPGGPPPPLPGGHQGVHPLLQLRGCRLCGVQPRAPLPGPQPVRRAGGLELTRGGACCPLWPVRSLCWGPGADEG